METMAANSIDIDLQRTVAQKELKKMLESLSTVEYELYELNRRKLELGEAKRKAKLSISTQRINIDLLEREFWRQKNAGL